MVRGDILQSEAPLASLCGSLMVGLLALSLTCSSTDAAKSLA